MLITKNKIFKYPITFSTSYNKKTRAQTVKGYISIPEQYKLIKIISLHYPITYNYPPIPSHVSKKKNYICDNRIFI